MTSIRLGLSLAIVALAPMGCGGANVICHEEGDDVVCAEQQQTALSEATPDPTIAHGSCPGGGGGGGIGAQKPDISAYTGGAAPDISELQAALASRLCALSGGRSVFCSLSGGFSIAPPPPAPGTTDPSDPGDPTPGTTGDDPTD